MTQTWHHVLFAHWAMRPEDVARLLPRGVELELHDGQAWVGVVPFAMTNVSPRGVPALPWISSFLEVNVRTYVHHGNKPGVYFFSMDASRMLAVLAARLAVNLPYRYARMRMTATPGAVRYLSVRCADRVARFHAVYRDAGVAAAPQAGTLAHFLTERYCLFVERRQGGIARIDIHHPPWPLQPANGQVLADGVLRREGLGISGAPTCMHYARRQDVLTWLPVCSNT